MEFLKERINDAQISKIAAGDLSYDEVVKEARKKISELFVAFASNISAYAETMSKSIAEEKGKRLKIQKLGQCPQCNSTTTIKKIGEKRIVGCTNYPTCDWIFPLPRKGDIRIGENACPKCGFQLIYWDREDRTFEICAGCKIWCWKCEDQKTCTVFSKK